MPIREIKEPNMPIKKLYVCDFCANETTEPNENWHRLADIITVLRGTLSPNPGTLTFSGEIQILCNACKDHLLYRNKKEK
jgi:hypothetical protein